MQVNEEIKLDMEMESAGFSPYVADDVNRGFYADLTTISIDLKPVLHDTDEPDLDVWRVHLGNTRKTLLFEHNFTSFRSARHAAMCFAKAVNDINAFLEKEKAGVQS